MHWQCDPAVTFLGSCPRWMLCSHLYTNIYGSFFVINNQNLENVKMSFNMRMFRQTMLYPLPPMEHYSVLQRDELLLQRAAGCIPEEVCWTVGKNECIIWFMSHSWNDKVVETENRSWFCCGSSCGGCCQGLRDGGGQEGSRCGHRKATRLVNTAGEGRGMTRWEHSADMCPPPCAHRWLVGSCCTAQGAQSDSRIDLDGWDWGWWEGGAYVYIELIPLLYSRS